MVDLLVGDHDPVPKLGFGSYAHEVVIFELGARKVDHVHEATRHTGTPEGGGVEEAGAADHQDPPVIAFFGGRLGENNLADVGREVD